MSIFDRFDKPVDCKRDMVRQSKKVVRALALRGELSRSIRRRIFVAMGGTSIEARQNSAMVMDRRCGPMGNDNIS
jgi:hypothetical protein